MKVDLMFEIQNHGTQYAHVINEFDSKILQIRGVNISDAAFIHAKEIENISLEDTNSLKELALDDSYINSDDILNELVD